MATPNYDINYDDERLTSVKEEESLALEQDLKPYDDAIANVNTNIANQQAEINRYMDEQTKIQNESLQNTLDKIEQDMAEAKTDYLKEQSGAYADWQKQSDPYGAQAEKVAGAGLSGSGYSESSQVRMYTAYQNRVAAARESYNRVIADYNIAMAEAKTQNSSILAEIAHNAMMKGLELTLEGITKNTELLTQKANHKLQIKQIYHNKYQDVLDQINTENALKEQVRMNDAAIAHQKAQEEIANAQLAEEKRQFDILHPTGGGIIKPGNNSSGSSSSRQKSYYDRHDEIALSNPANGIKDNGKKSGNETKIANRNGNGWIEIPGHGRFSYAEVYAYVEDGTVKETTVDGKLKYTWVGKKKNINVTPNKKGYEAKMKRLLGID